IGWVRSAGRASEMSPPQETELAGRPTPRKDSVASATMYTPRFTVAVTITGAIALGTTCLTRFVTEFAPNAVDAVTKSWVFTEMTEPRMMRAMLVQPKMPRTMITIQTFIESTRLAITIAARISGIAKKMSVMRDRSA